MAGCGYRMTTEVVSREFETLGRMKLVVRDTCRYLGKFYVLLGVVSLLFS